MIIGMSYVNCIFQLLGLEQTSWAEDHMAIVILASDRLVNYQNEQSNTEDDVDSSPIQRCLVSTAWNFKTPCARLEQPNVVGGVPAASKYTGCAN